VPAGPLVQGAQEDLQEARQEGQGVGGSESSLETKSTRGEHLLYRLQIVFFCDSFGYRGCGQNYSKKKVPTVLFLESHERKLFLFKNHKSPLCIQALLLTPERCIFGEVWLRESCHELLRVHVLPYNVFLKQIINFLKYF
jgi:hypothetical protein